MKEKTERNQAILEFCENPNLTLKSIGFIFGISKQRVHAIRKAYQKPPQPRETTLNPFKVLWHRLGTMFRR